MYPGSWFQPHAKCSSVTAPAIEFFHSSGRPEWNYLVFWLGPEATPALSVLWGVSQFIRTLPVSLSQLTSKNKMQQRERGWRTLSHQVPGHCSLWPLMFWALRTLAALAGVTKKLGSPVPPVSCQQFLLLHPLHFCPRVALLSVSHRTSLLRPNAYLQKIVFDQRTCESQHYMNKKTCTFSHCLLASPASKFWHPAPSTICSQSVCPALLLMRCPHIHVQERWALPCPPVCQCVWVFCALNLPREVTFIH